MKELRDGQALARTAAYVPLRMGKERGVIFPLCGKRPWVFDGVLGVHRACHAEEA